MGGCYHALSALHIPPGPRSGIKMIMFETEPAPRSVLSAKAAECPTHLVLSEWSDQAGAVGSVLALVENGFKLLVDILDEHPQVTHVLFAGGSPCQGLSRAKSNAKGVYDERSALIFVFHALPHKALAHLRGRASVAVVLENVVMHPDCEVTGNISLMLGVSPQRADAKLWAHCDRDRNYWSSYRAKPLPAPSAGPPDFSKVLRTGWRPLWELMGVKQSTHLSVFLRPFPPHIPSEHVTEFWKFPLHRYDERGFVYLESAPQDVLEKIKGFIHSTMRKPASQLRTAGSEANRARALLCHWIHKEGGSQWLRPPDSEERDMALGFPPGASRLPLGGPVSSCGEEFDRCGLSGNAWSPPAAAHVLSPLADHILKGEELVVTLNMPDFVSKEGTQRLLQPSGSFFQEGGRGRR